MVWLEWHRHRRNCSSIQPIDDAGFRFCICLLSGSIMCFFSSSPMCVRVSLSLPFFFPLCIMYMRVCVCVISVAVCANIYFCCCCSCCCCFQSFCTISYFFRRSTVSFFGSYFFLAASLARSSAAVIFKLSVSLLAPFVVAARMHALVRLNECNERSNKNKMVANQKIGMAFCAYWKCPKRIEQSKNRTIASRFKFEQ